MPLALVALASALDRSRFDVVIVDAPARSRSAAARARSDRRRAVPRDQRADRRADSRRARRVACGQGAPAATARSSGAAGIRRSSPTSASREPSIDVAVIGQGEHTFVEIVERLAAGESVAGCPGTVRAASAASSRARRARSRDLNSCRAHDYSLLPVERYFALKRQRQTRLHLVAGLPLPLRVLRRPRGVSRAAGPGSTERVAAEIADLAAALCDRGARVPGRDVLHASRARRSAGRRACSRATCASTGPRRCAPIRPAVWARRSSPRPCGPGLRRVMVGVESGSQATLDRLEKDMRIEQVITAAELCARHDVGVIFNFIVGFPGRVRRQHRTRRSRSPSVCAACTRGSRRRSSITGRIREIRSPNAPAPTATRFPRGLEAWADFDYVGGRGPWVSAARWRQVERFKFYTRHAWQPGRLALAAPRRVAMALRSRLVRLPGREGARRARPAAAAGVVMDILLTHGYFLSRGSRKSSASCGRIRRSACCICRRTSRRAASTSASSTARFSGSRTSRRAFAMRVPPVVGIAVNLMTKRNALRMIATARAAGARVVVGGPDPPHHAEQYLARRRRCRRHRRRRADARRAAAGAATAGVTIAWPGSPGIVYRSASARPTLTTRNQPRPLLPDLDAQPFPDREAIDIPAYLAAWRQPSRLRARLAHHRARLSRTRARGAAARSSARRIAAARRPTSPTKSR